MNEPAGEFRASILISAVGASSRAAVTSSPGEAPDLLAESITRFARELGLITIQQVGQGIHEDSKHHREP